MWKKLNLNTKYVRYEVVIVYYKHGTKFILWPAELRHYTLTQQKKHMLPSCALKMEMLCFPNSWFSPTRLYSVIIKQTTLGIVTVMKTSQVKCAKCSQLCARVDLATSSATTIAVCQLTKLATKWMTAVTSVMNLIAHVQVMITSAVDLVSAFLPVSAVTVTPIVQMQVMKCIVRVSK